jgi:hypothetical protein
MHNFNSYRDKLINEAYHLNFDAVKLSNFLYEKIKDTKDRNSTIKVDDLKIPIEKFVIEILETSNFRGMVNTEKSYKSGEKWIVYLILRSDFDVSVISHEMDHVLKLIKKGKSDILKKMAYISASSFFLNDEECITNFFRMIYLSSEEEVTAVVNETYSLVKRTLEEESFNSEEEKRKRFYELIEESRGYEIAETLINFTSRNNFKGMTQNSINKFFYLYNESRSDLEKMIKKEPIFIRKVRLFLYNIKKIWNNELHSYPDRIYGSSRKGEEYYEKWINSQGLSLKKRLFSLYYHLI